MSAAVVRHRPRPSDTSSSSGDVIMPLQSINNNSWEWRRAAPSAVSSVTCCDVTSSDVQAAAEMSTTVNIPTDPRMWSRQDVYNWLQWMRLSRDVDVDAERFRMNGKALCLMSRDMFAYRVPHGSGGALLFRDFRLRLCHAVAASLQQPNCACGVAATSR